MSDEIKVVFVDGEGRCGPGCPSASYEVLKDECSVCKIMGTTHFWREEPCEPWMRKHIIVLQKVIDGQKEAASDYRDIIGDLKTALAEAEAALKKTGCLDCDAYHFPAGDSLIARLAYAEDIVGAVRASVERHKIMICSPDTEIPDEDLCVAVSALGEAARANAKSAVGHAEVAKTLLKRELEKKL